MPSRISDVFAVEFEVIARTVEVKPGDLMLRALTSWLERKRIAVPRFTWDDPTSDRFADGSTFRWAPYRDGPCDLFDFSLRHADSTDSALTWITRAQFLSTGGKNIFGLRVGHSYALAGGPNRLTTRPRLLLDVHDAFEITRGEGALQVRPLAVSREGIEDFVRHLLMDSSRRVPTVVLTVGKDGQFAVPPRTIGQELFGLADVYAIESTGAVTALARVLGRRELAVFDGALRVYNPGFNERTNPFEHPLVVGARLREKRNREQLAKRLALGTVRWYREDPMFEELREERTLAYDESRRIARNDVARAWEQARNKADYEQIAVQIDEENQALHAELQELRERLRESEQKAAALQHALSARELRPRDIERNEPLYATPPESVEEAVHRVRSHYGELLYFLPSALKSARESTYRSPTEVARQLDGLARIAQRVQEGTLTGTLAQAFKKENLAYAPGVSEGTSKRLSQQYRFRDGTKTFVCAEHLRKGNSKDPSGCLRIYFTSEELDDGRFVVGHIGAHLETSSTN